MCEHNFTLVIAGDVDEHLDELFDAGCDDALFGEVDGVPYAEFDRDAPTLADAILSAIRDVETVNGLRVLWQLARGEAIRCSLLLRVVSG